MAERARRAPVFPIALAAATGAIAYAVTFYPGGMGFDTAYQWWQARGGETSNVHALGMTWLWRIADLFHAGPAPLFVLQLALFWTGTGLVAARLRASPSWRIAFLLVAALAPVCFLLFSFVASDVMFMATLACAFGLLLTGGRAGGRVHMGLALALLVLAMLLRKNALPAVFPLLVYACAQIGRVGRPAGAARAFVTATAAGAILFAAVVLLDRTVDRRVSIFPATALWDLAAVSVAVNEILLPPASHGPELTLDDLRGAVGTYANTTLFEHTHAGMRQPFLQPDDPLRADIARAWTRMVLDHPGAYLAHRWRFTCALLGSKQPDWPRELVYIDGEYQYDGNPPVAGNTNAAHARMLAVFERLRSTALVAAWPYLAAALIALATAWRRRSDAHARAALAVLASGLLYAAPLPLIAPSCELRYLGWSCLATIFGSALVLSSLRRQAD